MARKRRYKVGEPVRVAVHSDLLLEFEPRYWSRSNGMTWSPTVARRRVLAVAIGFWILTLCNKHFDSTYADLGDRFEELTRPQLMKAIQFANKEPPIFEKTKVFDR
jgi:hypothetical protein